MTNFNSNQSQLHSIQTQPVELVQTIPPANAWSDPYSPVAIILATAALVTAIGTVIHKGRS